MQHHPQAVTMSACGSWQPLVSRRRMTQGVFTVWMDPSRIATSLILTVAPISVVVSTADGGLRGLIIA